MEKQILNKTASVLTAKISFMAYQRRGLILYRTLIIKKKESIFSNST
jgi:hypothetical protein